ncbi:MAG: HipA N-terminal domain-containing protein [Bacteroidetes bacterium]|jgi:serine/threonine-protein kinase HipA|nr:HipA N-terminal domain-containing protein [Bacteroidota bacterium]
MSLRKGIVYYRDKVAGTIEETDEGYVFTYNADYLSSSEAKPVSLTLPISKTPYRSRTMIPFFDGLIPEGWLLDIAEKNWKLDPRDRMGLLLACCRDCIGAISVVRVESEVTEND